MEIKYSLSAPNVGGCRQSSGSFFFALGWKFLVIKKQEKQILSGLLRVQYYYIFFII